MRFYETPNHQPRLIPKERVDWHAKRLGEAALNALRFTDEQDYDIEISPETGGAILNQMVDEMDAVWVLDTRDATKWMIFRDEIGTDQFDMVLQGMRAHGLVQYTYEPAGDLEDVYRNRRVADLSRADSFPQEWLNPPSGEAPAHE